MTDCSSPLPRDIERDPTHLAAAEWFIRLYGREVSIEDTLAWQAWLNESPENVRAFARIEELSQALRSVPVPERVSQRELTRDRYDASIPLKDWSPRRRGLQPRLTLTLAALLAGIACGLTLALWQPAAPDTFKTAVGENRTIDLTDGSTITLGGDTHIEVALSGRARTVELFSGEALFKVARDVSRPFRVRVGDATIVAIGTAFDVQRGSDRAIVSVTEGRVVVEPATYFLPVAVLQEFKPKLRPVHLDAGEQTIAGSAGIEEPTRVVDTAAATAWQSGRLAFRLEPLRYVVEDVNRYAPKPLLLEGNGLDSLLITGTVERENISGWISSLERAFDLEATEETDRIVIRAR
jgi:transmembrane sensor